MITGSDAITGTDVISPDVINAVGSAKMMSVLHWSEILSPGKRMIPYSCNTDQPTDFYQHALKLKFILCDGMVIDRWIQTRTAGRVERVRYKKKMNV